MSMDNLDAVVKSYRELQDLAATARNEETIPALREKLTQLINVLIGKEHLIVYLDSYLFTSTIVAEIEAEQKE